MKKAISDGDHRVDVVFPDRYVEFSRTSSGGIIYFNSKAPLHKRWLCKHESFGEKYFSNREDILKWTVEQMRERLR
jgi:hypothetical protein